MHAIVRNQERVRTINNEWLHGFLKVPSRQPFTAEKIRDSIMADAIEMFRELRAYRVADSANQEFNVLCNLVIKPAFYSRLPIN